MVAKQPENEPVQLKNLSTPRKNAAKKIVQSFGENIVPNVEAAAEGQQRQSENATDPGKSKAYAARARRLSAVAKELKPKPLTLRQAAKNRVALVESAATDLSPKTDKKGNPVYQWGLDSSKVLDKSKEGKPVLQGTRLPGEALAGLGFYHREHRVATAALPDNEAAFGATAAASSRARVEDEQASFGEIAKSHISGASIFMHPSIAQHLDAHGAPVPSHMIGSTVLIKDLPAESLAKLASPDIRPMAQLHATGVDLKQYAKTNRESTLVSVIKAVRGETDADKIQNPFTAPKTASFSINKREATPDTEDEYLARFQHLGRAIRGEIEGSQQMFDFHGLRDSNEGILSNEGHSTSDSWDNSVNYHHMLDPRYPDRKAMGEVVPGSKSAIVNGKRISVHPSPDVGGQAVYHAFNNAAASEAAKTLQEKYNLSYTVPAAGVQEVVWAPARRMDRKETSEEFKTADRGMRDTLRAQANSTRHNLRKNERLNSSFEANVDRLASGKAPKLTTTQREDGMLF
jgi:hypothetical protein